jgi:hypothetical protein
MRRTIKVDKNRLERFKFKNVDQIKRTIKKNPELSVKLKEDFIGTAKAQGVTLDAEALEEIRVEWRTQIQNDIKTKAKTSPKKDQWYLTQVLENKPIKLRVSVDKETGQHKKKLRREK